METTIANTSAVAEELVTVKRRSLLQPDSEMPYLTEYTPYAEGAPLDEFMDEATIVVNAIKKTGVKLENLHSQALFLMRGFYLLGVLRGGEAYRGMMRDIVEPDNLDPAESLPFSLDDVLADDFAFDLNGLTQEKLTQLWADLGLIGGSAK